MSNKMYKLYVVATPIGNLEDISPRALRVLGEEANLILCEDTRVTKKLLSHYGIRTKVMRMDANIEGKITANISNLFNEWETIALVTDAGTPTISDSGDRFVNAALSAEISVEAIPGASAVVAALSISGISASQFVFLGFAPRKKGRESFFKEIEDSSRLSVFYESPHRILKTLEFLKKHLDDGRQVVIVREMTKIHEEVVRGTADEVFLYYSQNPDKVRGEFVVVVGPA